MEQLSGILTRDKYKNMQSPKSFLTGNQKKHSFKCKKIQLKYIRHEERCIKQTQIQQSPIKQKHKQFMQSINWGAD